MRQTALSTLFPYTTLFRSISFDKTDPVLLKVDSQSGKTIWKSVKCGQQTFLTGKYIFGTSTTMGGDRKSTRLNSSHQIISYAVFCLKKKMRLLRLLSCYIQ